VPWWEAILDGLAVLAVLLLVGFLALFVRRRWLGRSGGVFECSIRTKAPKNPTSPRGWKLGVGRYTGNQLEWFRIFSFSPRPRYVLGRGAQVTGRRTPPGAEAFSLSQGHSVIEVAPEPGVVIELAMSERALTGFLAWTEAAPPGHDRLLA
jgi:hypothetical protein